MKYIKYFEGISLLRVNRNLECEELKDFCEEGLCYLVDEGFIIRVEPRDREDQYDIFISKSHYSIHVNTDIEYTFSYEDVCDHLIPFLKRLNKEYLLRDPFDFYRAATTERFNNTIAVYYLLNRPGRATKQGKSLEIKDVLTDDKSNIDIKELYRAVVSDIKISVIPRKWNRHIHTGSLMDIQYPNN